MLATELQVEISSVSPIRLYLWPHRVLFIGPSPDNERHRHHAAQICLSLTDALRFDDGITTRDLPGVIVPPDCEHRISAGTAPILSLYLEPESNDYNSLLAPWLQRTKGNGAHAVALSDASLTRLRDLYAVGGAPHHAWSVCASALGIGLTSAAPSRLDPRIRQAIDIIRREPSASHTVESLARMVHLSAGRFSHVFRHETGIAIRRFIVWVRIRQVIESALDGASLTQAAHAAGFADAAHMSHAFRRMFGFPPSSLFAAHIEKDVHLVD